MAERNLQDDAARPRVYTIPPGAPFLVTLVDALLDGTLVPGFSRAAGPLSLADATLFVPTRRSARALAAIFAERIDAPATFLPRILPLGGLDAMETDALLDDVGFGDGLDAGHPAAIEPMARRMILTRLILAWSASVRGAMVAAGPAGRETHASESLLVATTPADAWHLSGELATLLDELAIDEVDWAAMAPLGTETFDRYWGITLDFLGIAAEHWPVILHDRGLVDPAVRQRHLIEAEIARLRRPGERPGPTIVAGSTGTNAATARLMAAIARLPTGAVVLPGLDQHLDAASWDAIGPADATFGPGGHSQAALHRLLPLLGLTRDAVVPLGTVPPALAARGRFVSEALRPAETTDGWLAAVSGATALDTAAALAGIAVIEAADEREEALALAVALRETLEGPGTAVLVTPDRTLARRVREDLLRWGIAIDDSGGEPLGRTPAGALARLVVDCLVADLAPAETLALMAHPAVRLGRPRGMVERLCQVAELVLFRGVVPARALFDPSTVVAGLRARQAADHAPAALRRLRPEDLADLQALLDDLLGTLLPLFRFGAGVTIDAWLSAHEDAVAGLVRTEGDGSALGGPDGAKLGALFDELIGAAEPGILLDRSGYAALFERIVGETTVRGPARSHPRLKILGPLEVRLLSADRILLGGLDETVWPPQVRTDAFLNRPMRIALGLAPPERRIGQSAHDFEMALGQPTVIVSRAAKRGGSPTVPSRFLQRMKAVAGADWDACRQRGQAILTLARALDRPARTITIGRPAPKPPVALRPQKLSVTRVELLRRDPYAIYAERILKLAPLDPVDAAVGPREWGTLFHGVLGRFIETFRHDPLPPAALDALIERTRETFADLLDEPHFGIFMGPRLDRWARGFHGWDGPRRTDLSAIHAEASGALTIPLEDGSDFTLTANADRLETSRAGAVRIIDYKTGEAPTKKVVAAGFAPQLTLEAAIAQGGGFAALGPAATVEGALYVKFGTGTDLGITALTWDDRSFDEVVAEHLQGLRDLLNDFRNPDTGYMARPFPQFVARHNDYDHLSRVKEWSATGGASESGEVGE